MFGLNEEFDSTDGNGKGEGDDWGVISGSRIGALLCKLHLHLLLLLPSLPKGGNLEKTDENFLFYSIFFFRFFLEMVATANSNSDHQIPLNNFYCTVIDLLNEDNLLDLFDSLENGIE